ncbi:hypothetical protein MPSEU_001033300 [Mayamaea pseudoterrestris]|nr:hypothetical protein MPSEU_001033300 [Mayamaea pseudoterrestris]
MGSGLSKHPDEIRAEQQQQPSSPLRFPSEAAAPDNVEPESAVLSEEKGGGSGGSGGGGCPMKRTDGSYSFDWKALLRPDFPHRQGAPTSRASEDGVKEAMSNSNNKQLLEQSDTLPAGGGGGGCPVKSKANSQQEQHPQYNVYSQPLDPTNNMPQVANQLPSPNQRKELSTERVSSSIPKGGGSSSSDTNGTSSASATTWTYPSPQMFYNALSRKNKLGDTTEDDIANVVTLHNHMNEKTWRKILQWEQVVETNADESNPPKLLRFLGRPSDLSPKAAFKHYLLGHPLPYDRHDWTIVHERDGSTRRYVIDYYHDESKSEASGAETDDKDVAATPSLLVDVRPAADDVTSIYSRFISMPYARRVAKSTTFEPLPMVPSTTMKSQVQESIQVWQSIQKQVAAGDESETDDDSESKNSLPRLTETQARTLAREFAQVVGDCRAAQKRVSDCSNDMECARASMDLTVCMGKIVCPLQHAALTKALSSSFDGDAKIEAALNVLNDCVRLKTVDHKNAKELYPKLFSKS